MSLALTLKKYAPDRFRDFERVGKGSQGEVWRARALRGPSPVAIKAYRSAGTSSFYRELRMLLDVQHPNVARLIEFFNSDHDHFLVFEYCSGGALKSLIDGDKTWSSLEICDFARQMLDAISWIHSQDLMHSDVKPGNILRARTTGRLIWKLTDFGISSHVEEKIHSLGYTPEYASPEALQGRREQSSDIYSLGIILGKLMDRMVHDGSEINSPALKYFSELVRDMTSKNCRIRPLASTALDRVREVESELRSSRHFRRVLMMEPNLHTSETSENHD